MWGTQFVFVIPMHVFGGNPSKVSITVAVTTLSTAQVDLHEPNRSVSTINVSLYNSSYFVINSDNNSVLAGDMSMNVYRLNSSAEVSVTFFFNGRSRTKATAGAMRLIPVDAFGREYYIFTPIIRGQNGYFQVNTLESLKFRVFCKHYGYHIYKATETNNGVHYYSTDGHKKIRYKNYLIEYHTLLVSNHYMCPSYKYVRCNILTVIMSVYPRA